MSKVVLVGPLPPPVHGEAAMVDLVAKKLNIDYVIDLNHSELTYGPLSPTGFISRILKDLYGLCRYALILWRVDTVYISLKRSFFGSLKDCLYIGLGLLFNKRIIGHIHSGGFATFYQSLPGLYQKLLFFLLVRLRTIIVLSTYSWQGLCSIGISENVLVIPNTLPYKFPQLKKTRHKQALRVLYLSHLVPEKGINTFIALAQAARRAHPQWQFDCYGTPERSAAGQALLTEIAKQPNMRYCGILTAQKKPKVLASYDVLVFPSTLEEGQPLVILEAYASGLAVLANTVGGVLDIVPSSCGALIKHNQLSKYLQQLRSYAKDPKTLTKLQQNARNYYLQNFTETVFIKNMRKVLYNS